MFWVLSDICLDVEQRKWISLMNVRELIFSAHWLILDIIRHFSCSHPNKCEEVSCHAFDLHSLVTNTLMGHLRIIFEETYIQIQFLNWIVFYCWVTRLFMYAGYKLLIRDTICQYFLSFFIFSFLDGVTWITKVFQCFIFMLSSGRHEMGALSKPGSQRFMPMFSSRNFIASALFSPSFHMACFHLHIIVENANVL
jgi:hypothetical protein